MLRAVQVVLDEGLAQPILIGRPAVMQMRIERAGLRLQLGRDVEVVNPEDDPRFRDYWEAVPRADGPRTASRPTWRRRRCGARTR